MGLFYFFSGDGTDRAGLGGGYIPRRWFPAPSSAPGTATRYRQQGRPRQNTRAGKYQGRTRTPGRWTRCTGLHSIPDRPRGQIVTVRDAGGRGVCPKLCRYGQYNFAILCQKNKSEKSYIFAQKVLTYKIYLI